MAELTTASLEARLGDVVTRWHGGATVQRVVPLPGGASSLTFAADLVEDGNATPIVVKVAPPGLEPVRNRDVLRQARVLRILGGAGSVPVPAVLFEDAGDPPAVPPLFAMTRVTGDSVEPLFDTAPEPLDRGTEPQATPDEMVTARAHHAATVLATLQRADAHLEPALAAEPVVDAATEVERWAAALGTVDPPFAPGWEACHRALATQVPRAMGPVVTHGDYRLGNMLGRGPRIEAVIDWEIWSVGDPRLDLAWFRLNADPDAYRRSTPLGAAMPGPDALLRSYELGGGGPADDLDWFDALAWFKAVATWSLILKRSRGGDSEFADVAAALPGLLAGATRRLG
jgi:aminoglycoside phosphotransferase (APT) family kinase protein